MLNRARGAKLDRAGEQLCGNHQLAGVVPIDVYQQDILVLDDISVSFDGFKALDELSLHIKAGELRCIIGPNGAGKTTLMDVITGRTRPDTGSASFDGGTNLLRLSEPEIAVAGIGRKFQKPTVFEQHTVFENLELAMQADKRVWPTLFSRINAAQGAHIDEVLGTIGLREQADKSAGTLAHGQKQWLEIGMLLMQKPKLLLIDEPVAGMTAQEVEATAELLTQLAGRQSVLVVEHDMAFIRTIAKKVTVLHQGRVLAEGTFEAVKSHPDVIKVYLGGDDV